MSYTSKLIMPYNANAQKAEKKLLPGWACALIVVLPLLFIGYLGAWMVKGGMIGVFLAQQWLFHDLAWMAVLGGVGGIVAGMLLFIGVLLLAMLLVASIKAFIEQCTEIVKKPPKTPEPPEKTQKEAPSPSSCPLQEPKLNSNTDSFATVLAQVEPSILQEPNIEVVGVNPIEKNVS